MTRVYNGGVGAFGDGSRALRPITVSTYESAYRYMHRAGDRFQLLVVDEAHHFGGNQRDEVLEMSVAPMRLGLTATPVREVAIRQGLLALIEVYDRYAGRRAAELAARLREPLRVASPADRQELARRVMDQICRPNARSAFPPPQARETLFRAAASRAPRESALQAAAEMTGVDPKDLLSAMFSDLPGERLLQLCRPASSQQPSRFEPTWSSSAAY